MRQSACLLINPLTLLHSLIARRWIGRQTGGSGVRLYDGPDLKLFILVGWDRRSSVCCFVHRGSTDNLLLLQISSDVVWQSMDIQLSRNMLYLLSPRLCLVIVFKRDLFVYRDDSLTS